MEIHQSTAPIRPANETASQGPYAACQRDCVSSFAQASCKEVPTVRQDDKEKEKQMQDATTRIELHSLHSSGNLPKKRLLWRRRWSDGLMMATRRTTRLRITWEWETFLLSSFFQSRKEACHESTGVNCKQWKTGFHASEMSHGPDRHHARVQSLQSDQRPVAC